MSKSMEIFGYIGELCWWILPKLISILATLVIVWMLLSWHDIVSDNVAGGDRPVAEEGNFFVEVMEVVEWFN